MSLNQSLANEQDNPFANDGNRAQMAQTLRENPLSDAKKLANLKPERSARRMSVSYTMDPSVSEGIKQLAKQNGFSSTSQYVEAIFKEILQ